MATKKLYFYSVNLLDSEGKVCNYKKVAEILKKIMKWFNIISIINATIYFLYMYIVISLAEWIW